MIDFDGADDYVNCGTGDFLPENAALSIHLRMHLDAQGSQSSTQYARIVYAEGTGAGGDGVDIEIGPSGDIGFEIAGTGYLDKFSNTGVLALSTVYDCVVTCDGSGNHSGVHIYLNDVEITAWAIESNGSGPFDTSGNQKTIGNRGTGGTRAPDGRLWQIAIFNRVLNSGEITTFSNGMQSDAIKAMSGLLRYFPMDDGPDGTSANGDTVRDESTNAADATADDGANNTGCTWRGTNVRVAALKMNSLLGTSIPKVSATPAAFRVTANLTTVVPRVTILPPAQIITGRLGLHVPKISNLPATFRITANLTVPVPKVISTPDAFLLRLILNSVTLSGVDAVGDVTVNVPCFVLTANLPAVGKQITVSPDAFSISSVVNGVIPQLTVSPAALRLISDLGSISHTVAISATAQKITATLTDVNKSITIPVAALQLQAILNAVELIGSVGIIRRRVGPKIVSFQNPIKISLTSDEHAITNPKLEGV